MEKAAQRIENELKCYKLLTIPESEKVGSLINQAQAMVFEINEEVQFALSVEDYLKDINRRIEQVSKQQLRQNSVLNQCESCLGERQEDIDLAVENCEVSSSGINANLIRIKFYFLTLLYSYFASYF